MVTIPPAPSRGFPSRRTIDRGPPRLVGLLGQGKVGLGGVDRLDLAPEDVAQVPGKPAQGRVVQVVAAARQVGASASRRRRGWPDRRSRPARPGSSPGRASRRAAWRGHRAGSARTRAGPARQDVRCGARSRRHSGRGGSRPRGAAAPRRSGRPTRCPGWSARRQRPSSRSACSAARCSVWSTNSRNRSRAGSALGGLEVLVVADELIGAERCQRRADHPQAAQQHQRVGGLARGCVGSAKSSRTRVVAGVQPGGEPPLLPRLARDARPGVRAGGAARAAF